MKIIYYGHSCFGAEINGKHLLFDPFITQNPLAEAVDIKNKGRLYPRVSRTFRPRHRYRRYRRPDGCHRDFQLGVRTPK